MVYCPTTRDIPPSKSYAIPRRRPDEPVSRCKNRREQRQPPALVWEQRRVDGHASRKRDGRGGRASRPRNKRQRRARDAGRIADGFAIPGSVSSNIYPPKTRDIPRSSRRPGPSQRLFARRVRGIGRIHRAGKRCAPPRH